MSEAKISTGVRLTEEQIGALKVEAKKREQALKKGGLDVSVGWTSMIGIAVDEMIAAKRKKQKAVA